MESEIGFTYHYSAAKNAEIEEIRKRYLPKQESKLERLERLDTRVKEAGKLHGIVIGVIGASIFSLGLCFGIEVSLGAAALAIPLGIIGAAVAAVAYPVYRHVSTSTKKALAPEILSLADELLEEGNIQK